MAEVVVGLSVSLDGYMGGPGRDISWHRVDAELHRFFNDELRGAGAFLDGRVTWELMSSYWPGVATDPEATEVERDFARIWLGTAKYVFSRTLTEAGWDAQLRREVDPDEIRDLAARSSGDLVVGGANLVATFRALDLVDRYQVYVHPVLLGAGTPLFGPGDHPVGLELVRSRTFGNGVVLLEHRVAR